MPLTHKKRFSIIFIVIVMISLLVSPAYAQLSAPTQVAPLDRSFTNQVRPLFTWEAIEGVNVYEIQIAGDAGFSQIVQEAEVVDGTHFTAAELAPGTYYWRVMASGGSWSAARQFTVDALVQPTINTAIVSQAVVDALAVSDPVYVIVNLRDPIDVSAGSAARVSAVSAAQERVLALVAFEGGFTAAQRYSHVPAMAGAVTFDGLLRLQASPDVAYIQLNERVEGFMSDSVPAINADDVHNLGVTGAGVRVAVLDTGIDNDHPDLVGDINATQKCYTGGGGASAGDCEPGNVFESNNAEDEQGHGTHVSGMITSGGVQAPVGFAPDAEIVAVRVLDSGNGGWLSDWVAGLNWIIANQGTLQVDVINMSLGTFALYTGNCDANWPSVASATGQLKNLGIIIFAASGNAASSTSVSSPACNSNVVAVGATYDENVGGIGWSSCTDFTTAFDKIACFTNSNAMLDILAPGALIDSSAMGGGVAFGWGGTSMASPTAAGVAALMLQADPTLTPAEIESKLKASGPQITDTRNGRKFTRIDALTAVQSVVPNLGAPTLLAPTSNQVINDPTPDFDWSDVAGASSYDIEVATDTKFSNVVESENVAGSDYTPLSDLPADGKYYWHVRSLNTLGGAGNWSSYRAFTLDTTPPAAPTLRLPADGSWVYSPRPALSWNAATTATKYHFQVSDDPGMAAPFVDGETTSRSYTLPTLTVQDTYYWRVLAMDSAGNEGPWSDIWSFNFNIQKSPADNYLLITTTTGRPTFTWSTVTGAARYQLEVSDDPGFGSILIDYITPSGSTYRYAVPTGQALAHGIYYWRVNIDMGGGFETSPWYWTLTVTPKLPVAPKLVSPTNGAPINDNTPLLDWNEVTYGGPLTYQVQIDNDSRFGSPDEDYEVGVGDTDFNVGEGTLPSLPDGLWYWRVRAINDLAAPGAWSSAYRFTVDTIAPPVPVLTSPTDASTTTNGRIPFKWGASSTAVLYQIRLDTVNPPAAVVQTSSSRAYTPPTPLLLSTYYWSVRAQDAAGNWSDWSDTWSVTIEAATSAYPVLNRYSVSNPTLYWQPVTWATAYEIVVDDISSFRSPAYSNNAIADTEDSITLPALPDGLYYWRMRALNASGKWGPWSPSASFIIDAP